MKTLLAVLCLSFGATALLAQPPRNQQTPPQPQATQPTSLPSIVDDLPAETEEPSTPAPARPRTQPTTILLLVNESSPQRVIVYDQDGNWLQDVRELKINLAVGGSSITAECVMWKGALRPVSPKTLSAPVREIKSVVDEAFNEKLEALNNR